MFTITINNIQSLEDIQEVLGHVTAEVTNDYMAIWTPLDLRRPLSRQDTPPWSRHV